MVQEEVEDGGLPDAIDDSAEPVARPDAGRIRQVGFYPVDVASVEREVSAALGALKARYGAYVSDHDVVYAGFSRGAFLGASVAAKHPDRFRRLVLIEGGQSPWQAESATAFARGGGRRVLFVCGQPQCVDESEQASATLRAQKVEAKVVQGAGEGHGYKKQVKEELRRSFDWVIEGDPQWR
jgi:pimeloyl-ACP methyl ester carboxylesterase